MIRDFSWLMEAAPGATICNFIFGGLVLASCLTYIILYIISAIQHYDNDRIEMARFIVLGCEVLFLIIELFCGNLAYKEAARDFYEKLHPAAESMINYLGVAV